MAICCCVWVDSVGTRHTLPPFPCRAKTPEDCSSLVVVGEASCRSPRARAALDDEHESACQPRHSCSAQSGILQLRPWRRRRWIPMLDHFQWYLEGQEQNTRGTGARSSRPSTALLAPSFHHCRISVHVENVSSRPAECEQNRSRGISIAGC
jgi:hypothetical protein